jgi:hypothetical protein
VIVQQVLVEDRRVRELRQRLADQLSQFVQSRIAVEVFEN